MQNALKKNKPKDKNLKRGSERSGVNAFAALFAVRKIYIYLSLFVAILIVFGQALSFQFIAFDDIQYVFNNNNIRLGFSISGIKWAFTTFYMGHWHPLTWLSLLIDYDLFGLNASGYHGVNVFIHFLNSILLYLTLERLTGANLRSAAVALLFAVHPLHVEPVVWISSRKDLLSSFFGILTVWAYLNYLEGGKTLRGYLIAALLLALGLMSKSMLITMPFVLLLIDYWPLDRFRKEITESGGFIRCCLRLASEKTLFFIESAVFVFIVFKSRAVEPALLAVNSGGGREAPALPHFLIKPAIGLEAYFIYIKKLFWPANLSIYYPYEVPSISSLILAGAIVLLVSLLTVINARKRPYLFAGWSFYLITLLPVTILLRADRYTYVPYIGLFVMIVWGIAEIGESFKLKPAYGKWAIAAAASVLAVAAFFQTDKWSSSEKLFKHSIAVTSNNIQMHINLGMVFYFEKRFDEAETEFKEVLRLNPRYAEGHYNAAAVYVKQRKFAEAIKHYEEALRLKPDFEKARLKLERVKNAAEKEDSSDDL